MGYEELYAELLPLEKDLKDVANLIMRMYKGIVKDTDAGNIRNIVKSLKTIRDSLSVLDESAKAIEKRIDEFDEKEYFESGRFAEELLSCCKEEGLDVIGSSPVYEVFPYRIRIDAENQEVYQDRKKMSTMRPSAVAKTLSAGRAKIMKSNFNDTKFAEELCSAYDLTVLRMGKRVDADILLSNIYKTMVPMSRFRKDYDQYSFAYDIARLYGAGSELYGPGSGKTKSGRRWQFGHSREAKNSIRILDADGNEQFLATIRFFDVEE